MRIKRKKKLLNYYSINLLIIFYFKNKEVTLHLDGFTFFCLILKKIKLVTFTTPLIHLIFFFLLFFFLPDKQFYHCPSNYPSSSIPLLTKHISMYVHKCVCVCVAKRSDIFVKKSRDILSIN